MSSHRPALRSIAAAPAQPRRGATLVEVLMSMLIMGLGITSVFTLFPMSILRSVKSTNLTHAALLAETARDFVVYQRATLTLPPSRLLPALPAIGYYDHEKDFLLRYPGSEVLDAEIPEPYVGTFVVDPLGGVNAVSFSLQPGRFGEVLRVVNQAPAPDSPALVPAPPTPLAGVFADLYTSRDSWVTVFEGIPTNVINTTDTAAMPPVDVTQFDFLPGTDLSGDVVPGSTTNSGIDALPSRVLATSADGRQSIARDVHFNPIPPGLPASLWVAPQIPTTAITGGFGNIGLVRVQNFERRYSYLFTMHRDELGQTRGQVVVFFRREYGESEAVFDLDPNLPNDRTIIDKLRRTVRVNVGTTRSPNPGEYIFGTWHAKPDIPAGNPAYRVVHGRWYRIVGVSELSPSYYRLTLDRGWEGLTDAGNEPRVMLPSGVISVFDL